MDYCKMLMFSVIHSFYIYYHVDCDLLEYSIKYCVLLFSLDFGIEYTPKMK